MLTLKINVENLMQNVEFLRKKATSRLCAVVKANAYGHGFEIVKYIDSLVDCFAVSSGDEATEVRRFTDKEIYVLCPSADNGDKNVIYSASTQNDLRHRRVCVKINSGMNRLGVLPEKADEFFSLCKASGASVDSVYTHFSDVTYAKTQLKRFMSVDAHGAFRHAAASNFLSLGEKYCLDMVRCGLAVYGYGSEELRPALSAYTQVYNLVDVRKGDHVGYSRIADRDMRVAVLGAGYADSIRRRSQCFFIGGKLCPSVGNICMDTCLADVSGVKCRIGDTVEVLGENVSGELVANLNQTIVYEILTSFGSRCKRIYC